MQHVGPALQVYLHGQAGMRTHVQGAVARHESQNTVIILHGRLKFF